MITLKRLTWNNCFSYGEDDNVIDFTSSHVTQLVGSNGVGKSSIPLILEEVLYNKNSKGIKKADVPNRNTESKGYYILLELEVDGSEYKIEVKRTSNIKVGFWENGESIASHTATATFKEIEKRLGLDFKTFSQLVYQNTNSSLQFLTATDTNRKKFLIDLFQLTEYVELFEVFKQASKEASDAVSGIKGKIDIVQKWLDRNNLSDTTLLELTPEPNPPSDIENTLSSLLADFQILEKSNREIENNNKIRELLSKVDINALQGEETEEISTDELKERVTEAKTKLNDARRVFKKYKDTPDTCHSCGQSLDNSKALEMASKAEVEGKEWADKLREFEAELKSIQEVNRSRKTVRDSIREWEDLRSRFNDELPCDVKDPQELKGEIESAQRAIKTARTEIDRIKKKNAEAQRHNDKVELVLEQSEQHEKELLELSGHLKEIEEEAANLEILKKAFSTNGLVAYKIENLVKELEDLANEYLAELSDGKFTIEFIINNDKLNVVLTDNGKTIDIAPLSSGELAKVNTSMLLAIRKLMSSISKSKINVLFLDEVVSVLDDLGKERLIEILVKEEDLNTFVVSHGWTHPLVSKIQIVKDSSEISRMEQ